MLWSIEACPEVDSVSLTCVTVAGRRAKNEIAEAKGEERRVEKSSREARDTLALSQAERAEPTLPALIIYLSRVRLQHSPHSTSLLIQLSLSSLPLLSIPTDLQSASPLTTYFLSLSTTVLLPSVLHHGRSKGGVASSPSFPCSSSGSSACEVQSRHLLQLDQLEGSHHESIGDATGVGPRRVRPLRYSS